MSDGKDDRNCHRHGFTRRGFLGSVASLIGTAAVGSTVESGAPAKSEPSAADQTVRTALTINGRRHELLVEPRWTLLFVLRDRLGLTGTKPGCERGECGACTVLIDGAPRYACMTLALEAEGREITTIEGLMDGESLGLVQRAFLEEDAFQCGYCTPGQIMSVEGLLRSTSEPGIDEIREGVSGNLCRCGAYVHIFNAAKRAAELKRMAQER